MKPLVLFLCMFSAIAGFSQADCGDKEPVQISFLTAENLQGVEAALSDNLQSCQISCLEAIESADWVGAQLSESTNEKVSALLSHPNPDIRAWAIITLGNQSSVLDHFVKSIDTLFQHPDSMIRYAVVKALGNNKQLITQFLDSLDVLMLDPTYLVKVAVIKTLENQKNLPISFQEKLVSLGLSEDLDSLLRVSSLETLKEQEDLEDNLLQQLIPLHLHKSPVIREDFIRILDGQRNLSNRYNEILNKMESDSIYLVRWTAKKALDKEYELYNLPTNKILSMAADPNPEIRVEVANTLGNLETLGIQKKLNKSLLDVLSKLFLDPVNMVRLQAYLALSSQKQLEEKYLRDFAKKLNTASIESQSRIIRVLGNQDSLADRYLDKLVEMISAAYPREIRLAAINAIGSQNHLNFQYLNALTRQFSDSDTSIRASAVMALGNRSELSDDLINKLLFTLRDQSGQVRSAAMVGLLGKKNIVPNLLLALPAFRNWIDLDSRKRADVRFMFHYLGNGNDSIEAAIKWLLWPQSLPEKTTKKEAQFALEMFQKYQNHSKFPSPFWNEFLQAFNRLANQSYWKHEDLELLQPILALIPSAYEIDLKGTNLKLASISKNPWMDWLAWTWLGHFFFWSMLILAYPKSPLIQATFFWNPTMRKIVGLGYVHLLLLWVPFLRRRLLSPFRDILISEAQLEEFDDKAYFLNSEVKGEEGLEKKPLLQAIPQIKGQIVLVGESGLGKSMFARYLCLKAKRPTVFLSADRCKNGIIPAIQEKLFGMAQDPAFLKSLVYSGALDVIVDGMNEMKIQLISDIKTEVERYFNGNIMLTTQPMEWEFPINAKVFQLFGLKDEHIQDFLMSRFDFLPSEFRIKQKSYEAKVKVFSSKMFMNDEEEILFSRRQILSNPMDLTIVALMLAQGIMPNLTQLHHQQFLMMKQQYHDLHPGKQFPFNRFTTTTYKMRLNDENYIPSAQFEGEIKTMARFKMVYRRSYRSDEDRDVHRWSFRHDKILDYFVMHEFLNRPKLRAEHIGDASFRGVYLMLARMLAFDEAWALREKLIDYSTETNDHSLSTPFCKIMKDRKAVLKHNVEGKLKVA